MPGELVEREAPVGEGVDDVLDPVQLGLQVGSVDSFHVRVRWNVIWWSARICRSRSRPIRTRRAGVIRPL
jgi:hypothetical protein